MLTEFKDFLLRSSALDLAVGIVIGLAAVALIQSIVGNLVTPLFSAPGSINFADLELEVGGGAIRYGALVNDIISFIVVAMSVFFFVVRPKARILDRLQGNETSKPCDACLSKIPAAATRCPFCTSEQPVPSTTTPSAPTA